MKNTPSTGQIVLMFIWMAVTAESFLISFLTLIFSGSGYSHPSTSEAIETALSLHLPAGLALAALQTFLIKPWFRSHNLRLLVWFSIIAVGWPGIWFALTMSDTNPLFGGTVALIVVPIMCCVLLATLWPFLSYPRYRAVSIVCAPYIVLAASALLPESAHAFGLLYILLSSFVLFVIAPDTTPAHTFFVAKPLQDNAWFWNFLCVTGFGSFAGSILATNVLPFIICIILWWTFGLRLLSNAQRGNGKHLNGNA